MDKAARSFVLTLLFTACTFDETVVYQIDPRLAIHADYFFEQAALRGKRFEKNNLIIKATPGLLASERKLAVVRSTHAEQVIVEFDEGFISENNQSALEFAMMHELGHAFLRRPHTEAWSIMNPTRRVLHAYRTLENEKRKLINELFD